MLWDGKDRAVPSVGMILPLEPDYRQGESVCPTAWSGLSRALVSEVPFCAGDLKLWDGKHNMLFFSNPQMATLCAPPAQERWELLLLG